MRNKLLTFALLSILPFSVPAFADSIYCPTSITCTGNSVSSCTVHGGSSVNWKMISLIGVLPGTYQYQGSSANDPTTKNPNPRYDNPCLYIYTNEGKFASVSLTVDKYIYADNYSNLPNSWKSDGSFSQCWSFQDPSQCPLTWNPAPAK